MTARLPVLLVIAIALSCALSACGPRMDEQLGLRPFKRQMPEMPPNTVPAASTAAPGLQQLQPPQPPRVPPQPSPSRGVSARAEQRRAAEQTRLTGDPTEALGERYYAYYCLACHGPTGKADLPVGESYNPRPTDLSSDAVQRMTDEQLCRAMIAGVGHEPVMSATVAPDRRPAIARYLRSLRSSRPTHDNP